MKNVYCIPKGRKKMMDKSKAISLKDYIDRELTRKSVQELMKDVKLSVTSHENRQIRDYLIGTGIILPKEMRDFCDNVDKDKVSDDDVRIKNFLESVIIDHKPELKDFFNILINKKFSRMNIKDISSPILLTLKEAYKWRQERPESVDALNEYINLKGYK
jgi:hypothetical protein